ARRLLRLRRYLIADSPPTRAARTRGEAVPRLVVGVGTARLAGRARVSLGSSIRRVALIGALLMLLAPGAARAAQPYPVSYHAFPLPRAGITLPNTGLTTITYGDPYGYSPRNYPSAASMAPCLERA